VFELLRVAKALHEGVQDWRGRPTKTERERLVEYCRRLDERRVFSAPFYDEVEISCIGSLEQIKDFTDEALSKMKHPAARAALGAILDQVRRFLDTWRNPRQRRPFALHGHWHDRGDGQQRMEFFQDLGELRANMKLLVGIVAELAPGADAPKLFGHAEGE
jgi:hypothetical protein